MANNPTVTEKAYNRLRQQTAKQLGESVNSDRVKLVVMLRLQQEAILIAAAWRACCHCRDCHA
jgi:PHD/YefM family antitoxin component YafN of YafNO toxin-antitoxin module